MLKLVTNHKTRQSPTKSAKMQIDQHENSYTFVTVFSTRTLKELQYYTSRAETNADDGTLIDAPLLATILYGCTVMQKHC